ncbi:MAG TPA: methyltransferase domain-containing protein [Pirellulales bacterium]|nr:methyltransferase domain-containing protein [Pirellulales bacterium]
MSQERFAFGKNWRRFLDVLDEDRIATAVRSLQQTLGVDRLDGTSFLDVGCGSGLFSLAARRLGATVRSFDADAQSVACALELKRRYFPDDDNWIIENGSAVGPYVLSLGKFDIVYAWGVLHHTGDMWKAISFMPRLVADDGQICLSIYNDQDYVSHWWRRLKAIYNSAPSLRPLVVGIAWLAIYGKSLAIAMLTSVFWLLCLKNPFKPFTAWYRQSFRKQDGRGMHVWTDLVDWAGGYPFEVARPEQVFDFFRDTGFMLIHLKTTTGHGCNEFVFRRTGNIEINTAQQWVGVTGDETGGESGYRQ